MSKATKEKHAASEENNEVESAKGFLRWIEIIGNKLPHPFWLFVWICVFIVVISGITAYFNVEAIQPGTGENITARNLLSGEGLRWFVENLVTNFAHFAPLGLVLVMLMGVSVAEQSGLLTVVMRRITYATPKKVIFPVPYNTQKTIPFISTHLETGKFKPVIDREYTLEDISEAYEYVIKGEKTGNVLINLIPKNESITEPEMH